jgi:hypothetical protein
VIEDVKHFGVSAPEFKRTAKIYNITNTEYCWTIDGNSELHHVLMCVGGFYEIDGKLNRRVPWIKTGGMSVKREFFFFQEVMEAEWLIAT